MEFVTVISEHLFMLNIHEYIIDDSLKVRAEKRVFTEGCHCDTRAEAVAVSRLLFMCWMCVGCMWLSTC